MSRLPDLISGLKALSELDLNSIRDHAEAPLHINIIGNAGVGKTTLINQLLSGPGTCDPAVRLSLTEQRPDREVLVWPDSAVILVLDASQPDYSEADRVIEPLMSHPGPLITCYNKADLLQHTRALTAGTKRREGSEAVFISAVDRDSVMQTLVPVLLRSFRGQEVLLARRLPLLREPVARKLIEDTCFINAAYSLASGIAKLNPAANIPLNVADMVVLTKNQALMAYKIALAFGLPSDWRQTIPKLAAVVGSAFLWRLIARQLVGLIPAFGIIPKIAVSYAGTYAVGQAIMQWCIHDEIINPGLVRSAYRKALDQGRETARSFLARRRSALPAGTMDASL